MGDEGEEGGGGAAAEAVGIRYGTGRKEWIKLGSWTLNGRHRLMAARGRARRGRKRGRKEGGVTLTRRTMWKGIRRGENRKEVRMMKRCHGKKGVNSTGKIFYVSIIVIVIYFFYIYFYSPRDRGIKSI